jgi:hypothetical protein
LNRKPTEADLADAAAFLAAPAPADAEAIPGRYPWRYGWGAYDELSQRTDFHPLSAFVNNAWQGGAALPDPQLGWVMLNAAGGHPGDAAHQAVRRWVAPAAGELIIEGQLSHAEPHGDGVRGRIVVASRGRVGEWTAARSQTATQATVAVQAGEAVDFVVDCVGDFAYDTFTWPVTLRMKLPGGEAKSWSSQGEFSGQGPPAPVLTRWESLAHVLLMSNEFMFVD